MVGAGGGRVVPGLVVQEDDIGLRIGGAVGRQCSQDRWSRRKSGPRIGGAGGRHWSQNR